MIRKELSSVEKRLCAGLALQRLLAVDVRKVLLKAGEIRLLSNCGLSRICCRLVRLINRWLVWLTGRSFHSGGTVSVGVQAVVAHHAVAFLRHVQQQAVQELTIRQAETGFQRLFSGRGVFVILIGKAYQTIFDTLDARLTQAGPFGVAAYVLDDMTPVSQRGLHGDHPVILIKPFEKGEK